MDWSQHSERIIAGPACDPSEGVVRWRAGKSAWITLMSVAALIAGPLLFSWSAFAVFLVLTAITLCAGHSVGMHRRFIHNSFACPLWLEHLMVYLGVLVGMAGPFGMMRQHDLRDWAQRQPACHDYLKHGRGIVRDAFWQLHCDLELARPPRFQPEPRIAQDRFYLWLERTWMLQQLPVAALLFALGGWPFVVWGVCARVAVSVTGHWLVGYFAHNDGAMRWRVEGAGVQGRDVPIAGLISMGESWHNNHHAFPGSARIGLDDDQPDPGWWLILAMQRLGLVWDIRTPASMPARKGLVRTGTDGGCPVLKRVLRLSRAAPPAPRGSLRAA